MPVLARRSDQEAPLVDEHADPNQATIHPPVLRSLKGPTASYSNQAVLPARVME